MAWIILGIAVLSEIAWALSLKWASTHGNWATASVPIILNFLNMGLLALVMRTLPAGTVYAIWTGLGAVGVVILGVFLFGEKLNAVQGCFIALIVVGVGGTKYFAAA